MYQETTKAVQSRLKDWTETFIHWEGFGREGELPVQPGESFIRPTIDWTATSGHVGGLGKRSGFGYLLIEIYIEYGNGRIKADRYAQELTEMFRDYTDGNLKFTDISPPNRIGREETGYYHLNVQFDFEYNECREQ